MMANIKFQLCGYRKTTASTPIGRHKKPNWYTMHQKHEMLCKTSSANSLFIGDSIIYGLLRYQTVWQRILQSFQTLNLGIPGDKTQNVLWRAENLQISSRVKFVVIHCGTNNIDTNAPNAIAQGILSIALTFQEKCDQIQIFVVGLLPRDLQYSFRRDKIDNVNKILVKMCSNFPEIHFLDHSSDWTIGGGILNCTLYYSDFLHLSVKGNAKLASTIIDYLEGFDKPTKQYNEIKAADNHDEVQICHKRTQKPSIFISPIYIMIPCCLILLLAYFIIILMREV